MLIMLDCYDKHVKITCGLHIAHDTYYIIYSCLIWLGTRLLTAMNVSAGYKK